MTESVATTEARCRVSKASHYPDSLQAGYRWVVERWDLDRWVLVQEFMTRDAARGFARGTKP